MDNINEKLEKSSKYLEVLNKQKIEMGIEKWNRLHSQDEKPYDK